MTEERQSYLPAVPPVSLMEISRVLEETARLLRQHADAEGEPLREVAWHSSGTPAGVRAIIAARWLRREFLGAEIGEAEWSLMLELYAARLEGAAFTRPAWRLLRACHRRPRFTLRAA